MEDTNAQKERFEAVLSEQLLKKKKNSLIMTQKEHDERVSRLVEIENGTVEGKLTSRDYFLKRSYKLLQIQHTGDPVYKLAKAENNLRIIPVEEMFDIIRSEHLFKGHCGRDALYQALKGRYANISQKLCTLFLKECKTCQLKKPKARKSLVVKPILSNAFNSRAQVDCIDMQSEPDGDFRYILNYQDHLTKFCRIRALKTKRAVEVANVLVDFFCDLGAPFILQSDNGREFVNKVIKAVKDLWPKCIIVHGKPRHSQSQGSIERANRDIQSILACWKAENPKFSSRWSQGLRFVQFQKNCRHHKGIGRSPYNALFGSDPRVGLASTSLPEAVLQDLETEEQLMQALGMDVSEDEHSDDDEEVDGDGEDAMTTSELVAQLRKETLAAWAEADADGRHEDSTSAENEAGGSSARGGAAGFGVSAETTSEAENLRCISCQRPSSGAHSCSLCGHFCHAIPDCSSPDGVSEEGFGQKRICKHCWGRQKVEEARQGAKRKQSMQAEKMLAATSKRFCEISVGDTVLVSVPEVDRGRAEFPNVMAVVLNAENGSYEVGTRHGVLSGRYARNQLRASSQSFIRVEEVNQGKELSLRETARLESLGTGQGTFQCHCTGPCTSKKCNCFKNKVQCNSRCHKSSGCSNKSASTGRI